ncbi:MAG TPA: DUF1631 family protein, partial [Rhodanobacteraceae bacterium]|nr:DUF1631 family protein [Rhodanobacteraceae bacterium]
MASSHGSPATDQPVKLPARALALLDALDAIVRAQLEPPLSQAVTEAEQQLFHRAELSTNNNEQLQYLDSQRVLKHRHDDIVAATLKTVLAARGRYGQAPPPRHGSASLGLELLTAQAQDENVVVDDLAARLESRAAIVLFELGHRLAVLAARPAFDAATQPYGPPTVCRALQDAVDTLDIPSAHRIEVFRAFERLAATRVVAFYETLNRHLAEQGILPQLRVFAPRRRQPGGSGGTAEADDQRAESPSPESARATTSATDATPPTATPRTVPAAPDVHASLASEDSPGSTDADAGNVFAALSELLAQRRRQLGPGIVHGSAYEPSNAELQQVLATLQTSPAEVRASGGGMRPRSMQQLRQDMLAQLRRNSPDASTPRLAAEHIDTMELMSMLFDRLVEDVQSSHGSQMLSQMQ